jgi:hypothetical protein
MAIGTKNEMVRFKNMGSMYQYCGVDVRIKRVIDTCIFSFCNFNGVWRALTGDQRTLIINDCIFDSNYGGAIAATAVNIIAKNNIIKNSTIFLSSSTNGDIILNEFINGELKIEGYVDVALNVKQNYFHDSSSLILNAYGGKAAIDVSENIFVNNVAALQYQATGIKLPIENNYFANNVRAILTEGGVEGHFFCNTFKDNEYAVWVSNHTWLVFHYNTFSNSKEYDVRLNSPHQYDVDFKDNYWGVTDSVAIDKKIYDFYNSNGQAIVWYLPCLTQAESTCKTLTLPPGTIVGDMKKIVTECTTYPNPFINSFELKTNDVINGTLTVYDLLGKKLLTQTVNNKNTVSIDLRGYQAGIYVYQLKTDDGQVYTGRVVKQ